MNSKTWVEVSGSAIQHNVREFRRHLGTKTSVMAVVKSNAYGHGLELVAKEADRAGAACFGVDNVDEGIALRKAGIKKPILVLGYTRIDRLRDCVANDLSFVVYSIETATAMRKLKLGKKKVRVHLKIETGTTRQGVNGKDLVALAKAIKIIPGIIIEGLSTHYANSEDPDGEAYVREQLTRFETDLAALREIGIDPPWKHTACTAAALLYPSTHFNLARVGIGIYGLWPSEDTRVNILRRKRKLVLKPACTWKAIVAQIKDVKAGTPVSYDLTERVKRDSRIAVIPVGYWDGYDRGLSSIGRVLIRGKSCKVLGRICMNMFMVDVTDVRGVKVEDEVVLLGRQKTDEITAGEIASSLGTINYEVVTRINPCLPRQRVK